jgi:hypothetical protein
MGMNKPHFFITEIGFFKFKERIPLKFKKRYQQFNGKGRPID